MLAGTLRDMAVLKRRGWDVSPHVYRLMLLYEVTYATAAHEDHGGFIRRDSDIRAMDPTWCQHPGSGFIILGLYLIPHIFHQACGAGGVLLSSSCRLCFFQILFCCFFHRDLKVQIICDLCWTWCCVCSTTLWPHIFKSFNNDGFLHI